MTEAALRRRCGGGPLLQRPDEVLRAGNAVAVGRGSAHRSAATASLLVARTELDAVSMLGGMTVQNRARYRP
jgi:hypothetical protein